VHGRRRGPIGALALLLLVTAVACGRDNTPQLAPPPVTVTTVPDPYRSTVAEAVVARVPVFDRQGGTTPVQTIEQPDDPPRPLVFLVTEERPPLWLKVLLPVRPNGSTGWIKATDVRLTEHDYRMTIRLAAHRITVTEGPRTIVEAPIGVGRAQTPTPGGLYYIKELLKPPKPDGVYGPYAYGLSGFSNELTEFEGGEGVIGVHGTNDPAGLGTDVSHGCIRMPNADIIKLVEQVKLPLGVPVDILA
jgi:lipoprotein-anchoring transpeptidase ErfK/SrfK